MPVTAVSLVCPDCGRPFEFTAGEQEFFAPRWRGTEAPFRPASGKPVDCRGCFARRHGDRYARAPGGATGVDAPRPTVVPDVPSDGPGSSVAS